MFFITEYCVCVGGPYSVQLSMWRQPVRPIVATGVSVTSRQFVTTSADSRLSADCSIRHCLTPVELLQQSMGQNKQIDYVQRWLVEVQNASCQVVWSKIVLQTMYVI